MNCTTRLIAVPIAVTCVLTLAACTGKTTLGLSIEEQDFTRSETSELPYTLAGSPSDRLERVFYYIGTTKQLAAGTNANTYQAIEHLAGVRDIQVNQKTQEGRQEALGAIKKKYSGSELDEEAKAEIAATWKTLEVSAQMATLVVESVESLQRSVEEVPEVVQSNPAYGLQAGEYLARVPAAVADLLSIGKETQTFIEYNAAAIVVVSEIATANGIEPPPKDEVRAGYTTECAKAVGVEEGEFS